MKARRWHGPAAVVLALALAGGAACAWIGVVNSTDNTEIHVVPAPAQVTIDGDLKDWDLSGAILMRLDETSADKYAIQAAMMYDAEAIYVGGHVKDPTPMRNQHSFISDPNHFWNGDSVQVMFFSNPNVTSSATHMNTFRDPAEMPFICYVTLWYSTVDAKAGCQIRYTLSFRDEQRNPESVRGAYAQDADGAGYSFEYRLPIALLRAPRPYKAGDTIQASFQTHWGTDSGEEARYAVSDLRSPGAGLDLGWHGPRAWGKAVFEEKGNLKLEKRTGLSRAEGHIPLAFSMPRDGKASIAVYDAAGALVRTGIGARPFKAGKQAWLWDGLSDTDAPLPPGKYAYRVLAHGGIAPKYVCDIGMSGTPPYQTADATGGWAGDYRCPFIMAADEERIVLGTTNCEAAPMMIVTDLDGRKLSPVNISGTRAVGLRGGYGYAATQTGELVRFDLKNGRQVPFASGKSGVPIRQKREGEDDKTFRGYMWNLAAVALVDDTILVSSAYKENRIYLYDLASGAPKGEAEVPAPSGMAVAPDKTLYVLSEKDLGRYDLATKAFTPILKDLDEPKMLACDPQGNVYVSLAGKTMQVWRVTPKGEVALRYGVPGGRPSLGKFNPQGMLNPQGIAVDRNGRLWVAEADDLPKRYSAWNPDGTLWKQFLGSHPYSTTACVDPERPEHVYIEGVRYRVDYEKGSWEVDATVLRTRKAGPYSFPGISWLSGGNHAGGLYANVQGRKFFWNRHNALLYEVVGEDYVPRLKLLARDEAGKDEKNKPKPPQMWVDANNDGEIQPEEIRPTAYKSTYFGLPIDGKLNLYTFDAKHPWGAQGGPKGNPPFKILRWSFKGFNDRGGLEYEDPMKLDVVADVQKGGWLGGLHADDDGSLYVLVSTGSLERGERAQGSGHRIEKYAADGRKLWEYQNVECAFAWNSSIYTPGYVVAAVHFPPQRSPDLLAMTGYYGQYFLLDKKDGLFVEALGEDQRSVYAMGPHMVLTENFNGHLFVHPNGKTYFLGGDADQRLWEIAGLDTIRREAGEIEVTEAQFAKAKENAAHNLKAAAARTGKRIARLPRLKDAAADGKDTEWQGVPQQPILMDAGRSAMAQIAYDDKGLFLRFQVADESPFSNAAPDPKHLFKSGDALDVQIGTDLGPRNIKQNIEQPVQGDTRILVARTPEGKMVATVLRYRTADSKKAGKVVYKSHWEEPVDDVSEANDLPMHCRVEAKEYAVELAVPWALLGISPKSGMTLAGDVGVIYGNEGGTKNAIRYLWADKSPEVSINNDIPSEVRVHPNHWGRLILE